MNPNHANLVTTDFTKWLNSSCLNEIDQKTSIELPDTCNILLVKPPRYT